MVSGFGGIEVERIPVSFPGSREASTNQCCWTLGAFYGARRSDLDLQYSIPGLVTADRKSFEAFDNHVRPRQRP